MIRPQVDLLVRSVCLALSVFLTVSAGDTAAEELRYGDRLRHDDLRAWQERLARFDEATPEPELLQIDKLVAYEENQHFAYAYGTSSKRTDDGPQIRFRRVLLLKTDTLVVDDLWARAEAPKTIRRVGWTAEPVAATPQGLFPSEILDKAKWLDTDDPVGDLAQSQAEESVSAHASEDGAIRTLSVFQLRDAAQTQGAAPLDWKRSQTDLQLQIKSAEREFLLELPRRYVDPGWITVSTSGETTTARRPLPAGILPHGEQGIRLIDRWDRAYRGNGRPGWDTGVVAVDLRNAVEQRHIQPCRTIVLGCGSGTNAIYLASKGFEVTAIDVAPTALSIAADKAQKAGVSVRWLLADVLNLPDLGTFDLLFDRGCYHNVRYVSAAGFVESVSRLCHPGTRFLVLSLNRDSAPGVREKTMRDDFSASFDFVWLKESEIQTGADGANRRASWSLLLERKETAP